MKKEEKIKELELKIEDIQKELDLLKKPFNKKLANLEIEVDKSGFTVWSNDDGGRPWIIDGSCLKNDGQIRFSSSNTFKLEYNKSKDCIEITEA